MNKKKILIVGNGNHQFITNYVYHLNKNNNYIIDILSYTTIKKNNKLYYNSIQKYTQLRK